MLQIFVVCCRKFRQGLATVCFSVINVLYTGLYGPGPPSRMVVHTRIFKETYSNMIFQRWLEPPVPHSGFAHASVGPLPGSWLAEGIAGITPDLLRVDCSVSSASTHGRLPLFLPGLFLSAGPLARASKFSARASKITL